MAKLTSKQRNKLPTKSFAEPAQRAYPIEDIAHARNALALVAQHGSPAEQASVRAKVYARYPELKKNKPAPIKIGKNPIKQRGYTQE